MHKPGIRVLKAISALIRIQILNLLLEQGLLSYTEIMNSLKLDATRDAGRFAYHLKSLLRADLIEPDVGKKKYRLTDLGRRTIEVIDEIEDRTYKRKRMLVRTSRFSMEDFDRNRIAQSLIKEAEVPADLALRIAREAEKRLQQFKTKYLTAPLIREIVNTILLERHYEEYRHNLTRLGLPVYDVTHLIDTSKPDVEAVHRAAANAVMKEYTLLKVLPRRISDGYLEGSLHLSDLGTWILKPNEIIHSLPFFLREFKPKSLDAVLDVTANVVRNTAFEITGHQSLDDFNIHVAPYLDGATTGRITELLERFIRNLNQPPMTPTTISLALSVGARASAPSNDGTLQLALVLLRTLSEENKKQPLLNPKIVMKVTHESIRNYETESVLYEAHKLAATSIIMHFANLHGSQENATYTASGLRLADEWRKDPELDTQRTGNLDTVSINLPRLAFDAKRDEDKFLELLDGQLDTARRALEIKYRTIEKRMKQGLLPYLTQRTSGDEYFRLGNATRTIAIVGLKEAIQALVDEEATEDQGKLHVLTERVLKCHNTYVEKHTRKPLNRLTIGIIPNRTAAKRFAELDVEKYGWGVVDAHDMRDNACYQVTSRLLLEDKEQIALEERMHQLTPGGHLALIGAETQQQSPESLMAKTSQLLTSGIGFFAYDVSFTHCQHCNSTAHGTHLKCPTCSSMSIVVFKH